MVRKLAEVAVSVAMTATVLTGCGNAGSGDCAAPTLALVEPAVRDPTLDRAVVHPAEELTIRGQFYARGCVDSGQSAGLHDSVGKVRVALSTPGGVFQLGVGEPSGDDFSFVLTASVPANVHEGLATITDQMVPPATVPVVVRAAGKG